MIHLPLKEDPFGSPAERDCIYALEDNIADAVEDAHAGEFDGDMFGEGECVLYMYGPDADRLFSAVVPLLKSCPFADGGHAVKQYEETGRLSVRTERVVW
jgi:hypothetical protein